MKNEKSFHIQIKNEDEPPDSKNLSLTKNIKNKNPTMEMGSFFIPKKETSLSVKVGSINKGIRLTVADQRFDIIYPNNSWLKYPDFYKKVLAENLAFALTLHLSYLYENISSINFSMARPITEPFFFKAFILALPSTALMNQQSSSDLIKKFFKTEYKFLKDKNILNPNLSARETDKTAVLPFTFGKDSLLTFSLCKELGIKTIPTFVKEPFTEQENRHKEILKAKFLEEFGEEILIIDNQAGMLREPANGWHGWELQLTQYATMLLPMVYSNKARYLLFSNEQSCNDKFLDSENFWCNPVYEQSTEWLRQIEDIIQILGIKNLRVGSLIEPLHDLAIIKILHNRYSKFAKYQTSCFAEKPEGKNNRWCGNCSKCARIYIFFLAHNIDPKKIGIPSDMLKLEHKNKYTLFGDDSTKDLGYDQSGLGRDEQVLAFLMAYKNGHKGELMTLFESLYLEEALEREKELKQKFFSIYPGNTVPTELQSQILNIYKEELKDLI